MPRHISDSSASGSSSQKPYTKNAPKPKKSTGNKVPCPVCHATVSRKADLKRHLETHDPKTLPCRHADFPNCTYIARTPKHLEVHYNRHNGNKIYTCPDSPGCPYTSADPSGVQRHRETNHNYVPKTKRGDNAVEAVNDDQGTEDTKGANPRRIPKAVRDSIRQTGNPQASASFQMYSYSSDEELDQLNSSSDENAMQVASTSGSSGQYYSSDYSSSPASSGPSTPPFYDPQVMYMNAAPVYLNQGIFPAFQEHQKGIFDTALATYNINGADKNGFNFWQGGPPVAHAPPCAPNCDCDQAKLVKAMALGCRIDQFVAQEPQYVFSPTNETRDEFDNALPTTDADYNTINAAMDQSQRFADEQQNLQFLEVRSPSFPWQSDITVNLGTLTGNPAVDSMAFLDQQDQQDMYQEPLFINNDLPLINDTVDFPLAPAFIDNYQPTVDFNFDFNTYDMLSQYSLPQ